MRFYFFKYKHTKRKSNFFIIFIFNPAINLIQNPLYQC